MRAIERFQSKERNVVKLVAVEALPQWRLKVAYSDGVEGEVDLSDLVGQGVFQVLSDPDVFRQVSIGNGGEITWAGKVDICSDSVYLQVTGKRPEDIFPGLAAKGSHA